ncbi:DUF2177 family protein [Rhizobium sp.]|jgi:uncharacterized membrane protein|uniref:DUF2177 family protein n=1 Tax=Rhizobium sp. TaxID=391 RepID=UPI000E8EC240|nr:DUF2177 domain-containing protein [Rhizobium sp.]
MARYAIAYLGTACVFFALDYLWLSRVAIGFYKSQMGEIMRPQPNFAAAGLFYLFYIAGIVYFAVVPAMQNGSVTTALVSGALLGLFAYGTYDMTNLATLKAWTLSLSLVDMAWGMALTGLSSAAGYLVVSRFVS